MLKSNFSGMKFEAGCDEAGRGCMAGPVFAAAVIFPEGYQNPNLNDSKKLNEKQREELRSEIIQDALSFSISSVGPGIIDEINILRASILAMHQALSGLLPSPEFILVDGNKFYPFREKFKTVIPHKCVVGGDAKYLSIAAASILAKTFRDDCMRFLHLGFPNYNWKINKGYGTLKHRAAMENFGLTEHHRKSFRLKTPELQLF